MSFLGMCSYCRTFIPNYAIEESPLSALAHGKRLQPHDKLTWTPEAEKAFERLKMLLQTSPSLGLPDPERNFVQTVDEKNGFMSSVLLQDHGGKLRPVAYFSSKLDPVAAGLPNCLRAVAAAEKAILASREIVGYSDVTLLVPHAVSMILLEQKTSHLSTARWLRYNTILLEMPNITVKRCTVLNPATLLPTEQDGEEHNCIAALEQVCTPRPDLKETPLDNADLVLFVDGSASRDPETGKNRVGYAVTTAHATLASGALPAHCSAQAAELVALTEACKIAEGKTVTIYTDSRYAFSTCHDFSALWRCRKFLKSDGKPIQNHDKIAALLEAILLPRSIAICKCVAHSKFNDFVSLGNKRADIAAKNATKGTEPSLTCVTVNNDELTFPSSSLAAMQGFATPEEKKQWVKAECKLKDNKNIVNLV
ncbi:uncharacterized protein LOC122361319 [Puntigrus tetrazona]|uniref:uncharacterized protein LOC122361319 n=1 Tax=Puntigrus tetrazona TaxID=1606681 RepID=UPI001C88F077|nr:uncharacterized protein LOC122361319 [Puntigrus tetrazona]